MFARILQKMDAVADLQKALRLSQDTLAKMTTATSSLADKPDKKAHSSDITASDGYAEACAKRVLPVRAFASVGVLISGAIATAGGFYLKRALAHLWRTCSFIGTL